VRRDGRCSQKDLNLPSKIDLEKFELLEGGLFYIPYFVARFSRGR